jgi:flagellar hook-associated protein 3 FlgL
MFFNGVPDLLSHARTNRITDQLKTQLERTSVEAITGRREDITAATGGNVGSAHLLKKALDDVDRQAQIFSTSATRLDLMSQALKGTRETVNDLDIRGLAALTLNDDTAINVLIDEAETSLRQVFSMLNVNHGDRNLFSGAATNQQSLNDVDTFLNDVKAIIAGGTTPADIATALDTYFDDPAGGFQTNIYGGSTQNVAALPLADNTRVEFTARADNQEIKDVLRGLATLAASDSSAFDRRSTEYSDFFRGATDKLTKGLLGVVEREANLGITSNLISKNEELNEFERITLTKAYNDATGRDQYEAANELKLLETQLQASYTLTARLSELTLVNYIR